MYSKMNILVKAYRGKNGLSSVKPAEFLFREHIEYLTP